MQMLISDIENILKTVDVEGLLELGAPDDEYNEEAREIFADLDKQGDVSREALLKIIIGIWSNHFGPFDDAEIKNAKMTLIL